MIQSRVRGRNARKQVGVKIQRKKNDDQRRQESEAERTQRMDQLARRYGEKDRESLRTNAVGLARRASSDLEAAAAAAAEREREPEPEPELQPDPAQRRTRSLNSVGLSVEAEAKQGLVLGDLAPVQPPSRRVSHLRRSNAKMLTAHPSWIVEPSATYALAQNWGE